MGPRLSARRGATVAVGWSGHLTVFCTTFSASLPALLSSAPCHLCSAAGCNPDVLNLPAVLIAIAVTILIVIGIKESANVNSVIVIIKVAVVLIVILAALLT